MDSSSHRPEKTRASKSEGVFDSGLFYSSRTTIPREQIALFRDIYDPSVDDITLQSRLSMLSQTNTVERPEFWVRAINNTKRSDYYRRMCLVYMFKRHLKPGDSPSRLGKIEGTAGWFNDTNVLPASAASQLPFKLPLSQSAFMYQPDFMRRQQAGILLRISDSVSVDNLILIIEGKSIDRGMKILEIAE